MEEQGQGYVDDSDYFSAKDRENDELRRMFLNAEDIILTDQWSHRTVVLKKAE